MAKKFWCRCSEDSSKFLNLKHSNSECKKENTILQCPNSDDLDFIYTGEVLIAEKQKQRKDAK